MVDPLAASLRVGHKALLPVSGEAMIGRVLRTAAEAFPESPLFVSIEDFSIISSEPTVAQLHAAGRLEPVVAEPHIVDSVISASRSTGFPLLLTTADNVLMSVEGLRDIAAAGAAPNVDGVIMMAERKDVIAAHPDGQRRFYRFRRGAYSNCNLFWLTDERAFGAIESFRYGGQFAKRKWDAVRALGLVSLLLYISRLVSLKACSGISHVGSASTSGR